MKSIALAAAKISVTGLFFFLLFRKLDAHEFMLTLRDARWHILLAGFAVLWAAHYICTFRWRMLMRPLMPALSLARLFGIYCIGLFFNLAFPTVVGGDLVKMYYAGKPSGRFAGSFAATFLDRDAGMLAMMAIACTATLFHRVQIPGLPVVFVIWAVSVAFVVANLFLFAPQLHAAFTALLHRVGVSRIAGKVEAVFRAFKVMARNPGALSGALLISFVNQLLVMSVTWIVAKGLGLDIPFRYVLIFVPVITLISMIPVSFNGMGLREYASVSLFGAIGLDREACLALGLLSSAIVLVSAVPGGILYLFWRTGTDRREMTALETGFNAME